MLSSKRVPGIGPKDAKIVIVGEAPGAEEERVQQPFIGPSGKVLNQMLARVGIDRQQCYVTNVLKYRPDGNDFGPLYEDPHPKKRTKPGPYLLSCYDELFGEIQGIKPNVIIAAGGEALRAVTGRRGIDKWRGSILSTPVGKCVPCYHPARILRVWSERPICEADLRRANTESRSAAIDLPREDYEIFPEYGRVLEFLRRRPKRIAIDIETYGVEKARIRCVGIADSDTHALCIPFMTTPRVFKPGDMFVNLEPTHSNELNSYWSLEQEWEILKEMDLLFRDTSVEKVLQNTPYDATILALEFGLDIRGIHMDTLMAQHTVYPELPKGLDFLCSIYTRRPYYSDYDSSVDEQLFVYNCRDCVVTLECSYRLDSELEQAGLTEFYHNHVQPASLAITRAQNRGIKVDVVKRKEYADKVGKELDERKEKLAAILGYELNPNSPKQMHKLLYETLAIPPYRHHKTGEITANEDAIERIMLKYPQHEPFLRACLDYRERTKLRGAFLTNELRQDAAGDWFFFTSYNAGGTTTGRLTASKTILFGQKEGGNIQQFVRGELREIFIALLGWSLGKTDLSQAEFRYVVWKGRIFRIIERYAKDPNFDVHRWNAADNVYHIPPSEVTKAQRSMCKNGIYGGQYRVYYRTASVVYHMPLMEAKRILESLHRAIPEYGTQYWPMIERLLNTTRQLWNEFGRRRIFFGRMDQDTYRQAYSGIAQSVIADIILRAFALGDEIFPDNECHPLMQVHDEIVWQTINGKERHYQELIKLLMEPVINILKDDFLPDPPPLVIPTEITWGPDWYHQKELKDETPLPPTGTSPVGPQGS